MGLKKKLGLGVASAALGLSLVGGGTFAYFSDTAEATSTFSAGTLDLSVDPTEIVNIGDLKPGDTMLRNFELINGGSLDIKNVVLTTDYTVNGNGNNGGEDFGEHIKVNFMWNADKTPLLNPSAGIVVWDTTLAELKAMDPEVVEDKFERIFGDRWGTKGLVTGSNDFLAVQFEFVENGEDQNKFQGDSLNLEWTFTGMQTDGEAR
ncbi:TasA family protein [Halobacillus faecis]